MGLQDSGLLVSLKLTQWTARKLDRGTSFEVCDLKHADQGLAAVHKQVIPKKYLTHISQLVNKIRNYHYANTLAWSHKGVDLLPTRNYMEYMNRMGDLEDKFKESVNDFLNTYPTIIKQVQNNLNELYDQGDYPSVDQLRKKFNMEIEAVPIPESGDFRVDIGKEELEKLKTKLDTQLTTAQAAAEQDLFSRLYTTLAKAVIVLKDQERIFRNSLIFNIEDICKKIPKMNINNNQALEDSANGINEFCKGLDIDELRKDPNYRKEAVEDLEKSLNYVEQLYEQINSSTKNN